MTNPSPNLFDDLFPSNSLCYHENTASTFGTLPKQGNRRDPSSSRVYEHHAPILSDLPRSRLTAAKDSPIHFPQPPPLLDGILLLDQMLTRTNDDKAQTVSSSSSTNQSGWYNVTSNYQTRASVV